MGADACDRVGRRRDVLLPAALAGTAGRDDALADFLTARWALHTRAFGRTLHLPNAHEPWPLRTAELLELDDHLLAACGVPGVATRPPDSVLFSRGVRTTFGTPVDARAPRAGTGGATGA